MKASHFRRDHVSHVRHFVISIRAVSILVVALFASLAHAESDCPTKLEGREKMVQTFRSRDYPAFAKLFDAYCTKNAAQIVCRTEKVAPDNVKNRSLDLVRGRPCSEIFDTALKGAAQATLYIVDKK